MWTALRYQRTLGEMFSFMVKTQPRKSNTLLRVRDIQFHQFRRIRSSCSGSLDDKMPLERLSPYRWLLTNISAIGNRH